MVIWNLGLFSATLMTLLLMAVMMALFEIRLFMRVPLRTMVAAMAPSRQLCLPLS